MRRLLNCLLVFFSLFLCMKRVNGRTGDIGTVETKPYPRPIKHEPKKVGPLKRAKQVKQIHQASYKGDISTVQQVVRENPRVIDSVGVFPHAGVTALWVAANQGHGDIVRLLIRRGADVNKADTFTKYTPLHRTAEWNDSTTAEILLDNGARVSIHADSLKGKKNTPLHIAAAKGFPDMVKLLLDFGAAKQATNKQGQTARGVALANWQQDIVSILDSYTPKERRPSYPDKIRYRIY